MSENVYVELEKKSGKLNPSQREFISSPEMYKVLAGGYGSGKALSLNTLLPSINGWIAMRDIAQGDTLFDENGGRCRVTFVTGVMQNHDCYEVLFDDDSKIVADAKHLWQTRVSQQAKGQRVLRRKGLRGKNLFTTEEIASSLNYKLTDKIRIPIHAVKLAEPLDSPKADLEIPPYILGAWLGDGDSDAGYLTCVQRDSQIIDEIRKEGFIVENLNCGNGTRWKISRGDKSLRILLGAELRNNKHIPLRYLRASIEQRLALLQGLMDTDGSVSKDCHECEFTNINLNLAAGLLELVRSLGLKATMSESRAMLYGRDCGPKYRVRFNTDKIVFRLERKLARLRSEVFGRNRDRVRYRWIRDVRKIDSVPVRCIEVDSPSHLYLASESMIPTHNSHACCLFGLILSQAYPGNVGLIGRFHASNLEESTIPLFFDVCPPSWIKSYNKKTQIVTLRNGSKIMFRHIHDPKAAGGMKSRRVGANLGWFFIDQMEECSVEHWNTMVGRLRLPTAKKRFGFATVNPNGHDWIYKMFFRGVDEEGWLQGQYFKTVRKADKLGIAVRSEENRKSLGGYVDDSYYDSMRATYPADVAARYLDCSFDDFHGKIYKGYTLESIHNIESFEIPSHWRYVVGIDVGGSVPWGISANAIDEYGNCIVTHEFYEAGSGVTAKRVADWIKENLPWRDRCTFVIDPENKLAMIELGEHGIYCQPAIKGSGSVNVGIVRCNGYFNLNPRLPLPQWFIDTQNEKVIEKWTAKKGTPRTYVFNTCVNYRREHDEYIYDPDKNNKPIDKNNHLCDADRYVKMFRPLASELPSPDDPHARLRKIDPLSARKADDAEKRLRRTKGPHRKGSDLNIMSEAMADGDAGADSVLFRDEFYGENEGIDMMEAFH